MCYNNYRTGYLFGCPKGGTILKQPNKQTAIYCRTASHDGFDLDLVQQEREGIRYAREHDLGNVEIYKDEDCSGATFNRPSFARMDAAIRGGQVSTIIVQDISRIGGDYINMLRWVGEAELAGAEIIAIDNPGFPGNATYLDTLLGTALEGGERE